MYFVGIDISKFKHDCAIIDELGDVITSSWSFNDDCEGFSLFRDLLNALDGEKKIGFESTGHYGHNLKMFLEANNRFTTKQSLLTSSKTGCFRTLFLFFL